MVKAPELCGRTGLAQILDASEATTRNLERRGKITPVMVVGGRPLYLVETAKKLRAERDAARGRPRDGIAQTA
jgi:hypothetical protein